MKKILEGESLEKRARELGVDTQGGTITQSISGKHKRSDDHELQKRVLNQRDQSDSPGRSCICNRFSGERSDSANCSIQKMKNQKETYAECLR